MKKIVLANFFVLGIILVACQSPSAISTTMPIPTQTSVPTPTETPIPTATNTPEATPTAIPSPATALADIRVRQAIAYCTDRPALALSLYPPFLVADINTLMMDSFLPKNHWAYSSPTTKYAFAPSQGLELLEQAGWTLPSGATYRVNTKGVELNIKLSIVGDNAPRKYWTDLFMNQMQGCGIHIERIVVDSSVWYGETTGIRARDFELAVTSLSIGPEYDDHDISSIYGCGSIPSAENNWQGNNFSGWCNPTASQAAEQADELNLTQDERKPYYATLQEEYAKDLPSLPIFLRNGSFTDEMLYFNILP